MKVITAKSAGFCFGVERAVSLVHEEIKNGGPIYTYGPIIHNEEVVKDLESRGVRIIHSPEELDSLREGTIITRSHGVSKALMEQIRATGLKCVDAACPFVKRIHRIVSEESAAGRQIVIIGSAGHPEVEAIVGWCEGPACVIETLEEAEHFTADPDREICVVSQTTFNPNKFQELVDILSEKGYNIHCVNTICSATHERQKEARELAAKVDIMIVIGSRNSSNSAKLYEICRKECPETYFIQTRKDLDLASVDREKVIGITAGASTPKNIIEEVRDMSEQTFEQLLNEEPIKTIHAGEAVKGKVIDVKPDEAILNIGYKSDGVLTRKEYTNDDSVDLTQVLHINDELEVKILKVNDGDGQVVLSYKRLAADRGYKRIQEAHDNKEVLTAKVTQVLSGGLSVKVEGVRVFIPASLVSDTYERDLNKYLDQDISFVITECDPHRRRYIGDRKQLLVAKRAEMRKKVLETLKKDDVVEGTVKNITDFGAFIDLGGADGLLHISEMSWGRVENPRKVFKVGEKLKVLVKNIDPEEGKIALSLKFPDQNPWKGAAERYANGTVVTGKVARMTDFGAFVELEPGIDALLHVSQIAREHIDKPSDVLKVGQEVTAKVVDCNEEGHKISLSIKALLNDQERARREAEKNEDVAPVDIEAYVANEKDNED